MRIKSSLKKIVDNYNHKRLVRSYVEPLERKYEKLSVKRQLTPEQARQAKAYWKELTGVDIPLTWHKFLYSRRGEFDVKYLPTSLYKGTLLYRANKHGYRDAYADKNMSEAYLPNVKHPETVIKNMNGYFYIGQKPVSREEAIAYCQNLQDCLIKPTLESHGDGVRKIKVENGQTNIDGLSIGQLFDRYKKNYCIQRFIRQHKDMAALNPTSVNTIRVLTFRSGMEIIVLYTVIRIGRSGSEIDNESAGGISTVINADATLGKYAYGAPGQDKIEKTDTGITLEGYKVPSYDKAVKTVIEQHYQLPFFDLVGWDIAIDESGEPVLVEFNVCTELSQSAYGPAFGEHTERIVKELMARPNNQNKNW